MWRCIRCWHPVNLLTRLSRVHALRGKGLNGCPIPGACALVSAFVRVRFATINSSLQLCSQRNQKVAVILFESWKKQTGTVVFLWIDTHRIYDSLRCAKSFTGEDALSWFSHGKWQKPLRHFYLVRRLKFLVMFDADANQLRGGICRYVRLYSRKCNEVELEGQNGFSNYFARRFTS